MPHSWAWRNKNNCIHERALRTVHSDYKSSFNELFDKDGSFRIHQRNVQSLTIENYKYLHGKKCRTLADTCRQGKTIKIGF